VEPTPSPKKKKIRAIKENNIRELWGIYLIMHHADDVTKE